MSTSQEAVLRGQESNGSFDVTLDMRHRLASCASKNLSDHDLFSSAAAVYCEVIWFVQLPEITQVGPKKGETPLLRIARQNSGMLLGAGIMLVIAVYELQLQNLISPGSVGH